jgi:hypothetical protein
MEDSTRIPLATGLRELNHGAEVPYSYREFREAILGGQVPAERHGREWWVRQADLPEIAAKLAALRLGMPRRVAHRQPRSAA